MIWGSSSCHASLTQLHLSIRVGFHMFPDSVKECSPSAYHSFQRRCNIIFIGLLTLTTSGCRIPVIPPEIIARVVLKSTRSTTLMFSFLWHQKASSTRRDFCLSQPGHFPHTFFNRSSIRVSSMVLAAHNHIHSPGNVLWKSLPFENYEGWKFSAFSCTWQHDCKLILFSSIGNCLWPFHSHCWTWRLLRSKVSGVWSAFPIWLMTKSRFTRCLMINLWKLTSFSLKSSSGRCGVLCQIDRSFRRMNP